MITYISASNADRYNILFEKATQALVDNPPEGATLDEDFAISTLNEYFAYLEDLIKTSEDEDISRFFLRLPLDEDFFEIDANSRTIKVPSSSFGRYGVGVQGDELAEVVYFTIDRFFDSTDLASEDIKIIIQWEAKDANKQTIAGISKNFGKDIEIIDNKPKIIFGWPISHELTETPGSIKFAVRFYQLGESDDSGVSQLVYSLSTLPAEVTVNASLDYDVISQSKIDHGNIITSRVKSNGIYDAAAPKPGEPIITVPLYVMSPEGNEDVKIVDLPAGENSVVKLAVCARNSDIGAISYLWKKFDYDKDQQSGSYYQPDSISIDGVASFEYVEVPATDTLSTEQEYFTLIMGPDDHVASASLVSRERISNIEVGSKTVTVESEDEDEEPHTIQVPIFLESGTEIHLYKKLSVASVSTVGEYAVDIKARTSVNSTIRHMSKEERIRIPGPLKPTIALPEETDNVSVTPDDNGVHAITNDGTAIFSVAAAPGEEGLAPSEVGEHPQVELKYKWKKLTGDVATDVIAVAPAMPVAALPASQLPEDPAWQENASENGALGAKGIFNQENVDIVLNGTTVIIYPKAELKEFNSTNPAQGTHQWLALDINTGLDSIVDATWDDGEHDVYTFVAADENELGVANGHILFWIKVDEALERPITRKINDTLLTFRASMEAPTNATYSIVDNELTIVGLPESGLDHSYFCEVTAKRNGVETTEKSGIYRVTNSPEAPVLSYAGAPVDNQVVAFDKQDFHGRYRTLSFDIEEPALSDGITYLWMHGIIDNEADYDDYNRIKAQIDLDGALAAVLGNTEFPGTKDEICDSSVAHYENGEIVFGTSSGSREYPLTAADDGIYYCIVINELNNNKAASVGPFFNVR